MPDAELSALADAGKLHQPEFLKAQVKRMLQHERSRALFDGFGVQWLGLGAGRCLRGEGRSCIGKNYWLCLLIYRNIHMEGLNFVFFILSYNVIGGQERPVRNHVRVRLPDPPSFHPRH
jgi:hypothetical protein